MLFDIWAWEATECPVMDWASEAAEGQLMDWSSEIGWAWNLSHRPGKNKKQFTNFCFDLEMEDGSFVLKEYLCECHQH